MHYHFFQPEARPTCVAIELTIPVGRAVTLELRLPAWRPGRYELARYDRYLRDFTATDAVGRPLTWRKKARDRWSVRAQERGEVRVRYVYHARQMDAGGTWVDDARFYVNFINCALWVVDRQDEPCTVSADLPDGWEVVCALPRDEAGRWQADDYFHFVDSPLLAAPDLQHHTYEVEEKLFHVWLHGEWSPDWTKLLTDFELFTEQQIALFGDFPAPAFHFIVIVLPYRHYHGVEHRDSTVITLGPAHELTPDGALYGELLGVSSHELFHAWNVARIRPAELMPYDFSRENYFRTGYVAEGVTTYYGDLMPARGGVFSEADYVLELNKLLRRHFRNPGRLSRPLTEASFDLWLDGYVPEAAHRRASIYVEGAVAALLLDLELRRMHDDARSLDDVLRRLWTRFGETGRGYTERDYRDIVEEVAGRKMRDYFAACIEGAVDLHDRLDGALRWVG
ncbi:MAG: M61 family peptidase, partial [Catalinimonas sp.]